MASGDNAYILANHGVLVLGTDAERAVFNMALLEKCSLAYLLALTSGEQVHRVPLPIREIAFAKLRADEKKIAAQVTEAAAAPPQSGATGTPRLRRRRSLRQPRLPQPGRRPTAAGRGGGPVAPSTPSVVTPTSRPSARG